MSIRSGIATVLDRPGGRRLLAAAATWYARRLTHADVEIHYDEVWEHRAGSIVFPDGIRFRYYRDEFLRWTRQSEKFIAAAQDYWFHVGAPRSGEVVVDVGAGRGEDLLAFSRGVGTTGRIIAVEAHPVTFRLLQRFCLLNHLAQVVPVHAAALDHEGMASIGNCDDWEDNSIGDREAFRVPAKTLDDICRDCAPGNIGLLKLNIEGSEAAALLGAREVLQRARLVAVACHDFRADRGDGERFRTRADVQRILAESGYIVSDRADDPRAGIRDHVFGVRG